MTANGEHSRFGVEFCDVRDLDRIIAWLVQPEEANEPQSNGLFVHLLVREFEAAKMQAREV
jgi:hypothetical protein